jgi:NADH-quinone oxidoreductase subunit N
VLLEVFPDLPRWTPLLTVVAALTLVIGNTVAMLQENLKRLLAYSGISHVGFLLMGIVAHQRLSGGAPVGPGVNDLASYPALQAVVFYVLAYSLMTLGAFAVVALVERDYDRDALLLDHAGLAGRRPLLAAAMLIFMLSLGGMPPLAGFVGKWLVFQSAISAGLIGLAVVAAITSVVAFSYYLRVVYQMYLRPAPEDAAALELASPGWVVVGAAFLGTLLLGVLPALVLGPLAGVRVLAAVAP